ncbi:hypothetical protein GORHZ_085_00040 [Gordonia rhizosphera NBRC 16068]|uniref:Uncharacterized protein n=1 Tax=Gordonia rhizosphera NBRC 16068 TaxID=1108045 RepID=K6WD71_9ACTN|nr:hypothetical protein GORHZ_085_00040 [Gordonia rhizosphera NBRC 16068]
MTTTRGAVAFGLLDCECFGGLGCEGGGVEVWDLPQCGDDVVEHPANPDRRVGQVDDDMAGWVQRGCRGADRDGLARTDLTGDHPDRVLIHAPGDAGDRFGVTGVAVQHRRCEVAAERHPSETVMCL